MPKQSIVNPVTYFLFAISSFSEMSNGQKTLVAEMGEPFITDSGLPNCRLRVVYDNGTEGDRGGD